MVMYVHNVMKSRVRPKRKNNRGGLKMPNPEFCSDCGKQFRNGNKAIAITGGTIDYKNYEGFRPNDDAYIKVLCPKCSDRNRSMEAIIREFIDDVESAYILVKPYGDGKSDKNMLKEDWYDLSITFKKAKKLFK